MSRPTNAFRRRARALLLPFAVYLLGVALLGDWIIDDAGISYAYARNAVSGHGFVSQPGRPPVEGFSNFLWVVSLMPAFALRVFDPVLWPKVLGAGFVLGAFALVQRALARATGRTSLGFFATALVAAAPPIVIWSASGLENGLTLFLVSALYAASVERPRFWQTRCGALAALLAMTRPDGVIYASFGLVLAAAALVLGRPQRRSIASELFAHAAGFALVFVPFMAFRMAAFGQPWPQPYYAKRVHATFGDRLADIADHPAKAAEKLLDLCRGLGGPAGPAIVALTVAGAVLLAARGRLPRHAAMALALQAIAVGGFVWMDDDWMGEYRFGTAAVLLSILSFASVSFALARDLSTTRRAPPGLAWLARRARRPRAARIAMLGCGAVLAAAGLVFVPRIAAFAANPPTPFRDVERSFARKLDAYADSLGIAHGSVYLADVGAPLHGSRLTVYDAAGLCEPDVVHTLKRDTPVWFDDHPAFYDWIFEQLRPTFISTHHFWTHVTAFDRDPRFARDYVAIDAYEDAYVKRAYGYSARSGDFVRRDALADFGRLARLRAEHRPPPRLDPFVVRLDEALAGGREASGAEATARLRAEARRAMYERSDPNRAATLLDRLLARQPADLDAAFERATALDEAARPDEARSEWMRVLQLAPSGSLHAMAARARLGLPRAPNRTP